MAVFTLRDLWNVACKWEGIESNHNTAFFSQENPWTQRVPAVVPQLLGTTTRKAFYARQRKLRAYYRAEFLNGHAITKVLAGKTIAL